MPVIRRATVSKEIEFDTAHRVPDHKSKCRNLHGHRYRVRATVIGEVKQLPDQSDSGMVIDFGDLKKCLGVFHDRYDHKTVLFQADPLAIHLEKFEIVRRDTVIAVPWIPTAENFAITIYNDLKEMLGHVMDIWEVEVWETPTSRASYSGLEYGIDRDTESA